MLELVVNFKNETEYKFFTFLNGELSVYEQEREVLLKRGVIIQFYSFNINPDKKGVKYILKGKVISFNQQELVTTYIKDFKAK